MVNHVLQEVFDEHNKTLNGSNDERIDKLSLKSLAIPNIISNFAQLNTERYGPRT